MKLWNSKSLRSDGNNITSFLVSLSDHLNRANRYKIQETQQDIYDAIETYDAITTWFDTMTIKKLKFGLTKQ